MQNRLNVIRFDVINLLGILLSILILHISHFTTPCQIIIFKNSNLKIRDPASVPYSLRCEYVYVYELSHKIIIKVKIFEDASIFDNVQIECAAFGEEPLFRYVRTDMREEFEKNELAYFSKVVVKVEATHISATDVGFDGERWTQSQPHLSWEAILSE